MKKTPYRYVPFLSEAYWFAKRNLISRLYSGTNVSCPVCHRGFKDWKPGGVCPYCESTTRHKALILWLESYLSDKDRTFKTLLFAPDFGVEASLRRNHRIDLTTTDYSAPGVDHHWDIMNLPPQPESYDLILCSHVMEHIPDDAKAFGELSRVLRKDGLLLLQVPYAQDAAATDEDDSITDPEERTRRFGQFDHLRVYGQDILDRMAAQNLTCTPLKLEDWLGPSRMKQLGLWNDTLFICHRSDGVPVTLPASPA